MKTDRVKKKKKTKNEAIASARAWAEKRRRAREEEVVVAEEVNSYAEELASEDEEQQEMTGEDTQMLRMFELKREQNELEREALQAQIVAYDEQQMIIKAQLSLAVMKAEATQVLNQQKIEYVKRR